MIKRLSAISIALCILSQVLVPLAVPYAIAEENFYSTTEPAPEVVQDFYVQNFIITGYYSPKLGQDYYVTGSYEGDIRLNGGGIHGASGVDVYPGMVAAPSTYLFGTKMHIPGIGFVAVYDRGGAIKSAGERGNQYDRLDIWFGEGDEGLKRALAWGKRTVQVTVYGIAPEVKEQVYFDEFIEAEKIAQNIVYPTLTFPYDIYYGTENENVKEMQEYLAKWGYFIEEVNGFYGSATAQAIFEFQLDYDIVSSPDDLGAGHFGPNTRRKFEEIIQTGQSEEAVMLRKGRTLMAKHTDLTDSFPEFSRALEIGDNGDDVKALQQELRNLGLLRIEPNGVFDEVTEHAVFKFQQTKGLVETMEDRGAGYVGPQTRAALNSIIANRIYMKSMIAYKREEIENGRQLLKMPEHYLATKEED
ncbi:peptidoglycan-binding protein [Patescibacteria group bacterium]|nr:peptidoglycan-binding protein [Patescibacteria group bacterium]